MYSSPVDRDREISSFRARQITKQVKQSLCVHALSVHDDDDDDCAMMTTPKQQETARFEGVRKFEFLAFSPAISLFLSFAQMSRTRIQQAGREGSRALSLFPLELFNTQLLSVLWDHTGETVAIVTHCCQTVKPSSAIRWRRSAQNKTRS